MSRRPTVAVIGAGTASDGLIAAAQVLGRGIVDLGGRVCCGGRGGVMAAVARGAHSSVHHREGDVIGVLPGTGADEANPWIDVAIPTGLGLARNHVVVLAGDVVVAVGGGSGTLSEIALAWQYGRPLLALQCGEGWSDALAGQALDGRARPPIEAVATAEDALVALRRWLPGSPWGA